jgi:predicted AAA+ superfamily ATPase
MLINRLQFLNHIKTLFEIFPVVALLGARQCGKSTLAKQYSALYENVDVHYFDLENEADLHRLDEAQLTLEKLTESKIRRVMGRVCN